MLLYIRGKVHGQWPPRVWFMKRKQKVRKEEEENLFNMQASQAVRDFEVADRKTT